MAENNNNLMEKIVSLAKRRGFVFPSSEIYGGLGGFWDFGPLGAALKNNIKQEWRREVVERREEVFGLDASIIMNPAVWQASGHIEGFSDPLADCPKCKKRWKADDLADRKCPECEAKLSETRNFNTMFKTFVGPVEDEAAQAYLRPETAQGIFVNFKNVLDTMRPKLPFGIAQIGKAFRNEITPGNFIFRSREFEQMELEYFVRPGEEDKWHDYWKKERLSWYIGLGIKKENLRLRDYDKPELAHYSKATTDVEYKFPFSRKDSFDELEGIASRADFDLSAHEKHSGKELKYFDDGTKQKISPYVIEPSAGVDRAFLAFLIDAYSEDTDKKRIVLKLHPRLSPYKAAVFPLLANKENLALRAREIFNDLKNKFNVAWDDRGNIGKRYLAQDELGTPYCLTIDFDTLENNTVTVRDRDTTEQERIKIDQLKSFLEEKLN